MLFKETISQHALELLRKIQGDQMFTDFCLAGGTGLALHLGHRRSNDLDLFSVNSFDSEYYLDYLTGNYGFKPDFTASNTLKGSIDNVKTDFITHTAKQVNPIITEEMIRLYSQADIAAMKINAIAGNGTRSKDFVDLYFLLENHTVKQIIDFYSIKYENRNVLHAIKCLNYFEDVDLADWPVILKDKDLQWKKVKSVINKCVMDYIKTIR